MIDFAFVSTEFLAILVLSRNVSNALECIDAGQGKCRHVNREVK
ncbi:hypothetical protein SMB34_09865 [Thalassospira permensis NBRC 106175]|uniref:Uncharacterized protein n=1 Tax=Thalassospira permensis NBRC 106175 TaxID=1353532 RepID=A0ABR4TJH3_9PROT|nr:hypothetical protein SMB34_09865 [Thalassospira permensis NBRC 106175]